MAKFSDYSGEFRPDLRVSDFSTDALLEIIKLYASLYTAIDGYWFLAVRERIGNDAALDCDLATLAKQSKYAIEKTTRALNIPGDDVIALCKALQVNPWIQMKQVDWRIADRNHATMTVLTCPTLAALEKEGQGREKEICRITEPVVFQDFANAINPDIKVNCLKAPPRRRDGICCRWEFVRGAAGV